MKSSLKNSTKKPFERFPHLHYQQLTPNPITNLPIFTKPQQQKPLSHTQPITTNKTTSTSKHHKNPSTTKDPPPSSTIQQPTPNLIHLQNSDVTKIIQQSQNLIKNNQLIQGINLLKALKDPSIKFTNAELKVIVVMNLAIAYYQTGFLEEALEQFIALSVMLSHHIHLATTQSNFMTKLSFMTLLGKVQLQICIVFSQMGKHQQALKHANKSCKINFQLIYDILNILCQEIITKVGSLQKQQSSQSQQQSVTNIPTTKHKNLINNIILLQHLHKLVGDLNQVFHIPDKIKLSKELLAQVKSILPQFKNNKVDMQLLFSNDQSLENNPKSPNNKLNWIFNNKILDQIQLKPLQANFFSTTSKQQQQQLPIPNTQIIQKITYLSISFYCYSTQIRFIQKTMSQDHNQGQVMDSQHWLSRSLQIAYSFMPSNAPILNQILTVHDRFHGIDKQTIPQDKEVCGYFKVLKPLGKPNSIYYSSKAHICSPIMIRIQPPRIVMVDVEEEVEEEREDNNSYSKDHKLREKVHYKSNPEDKTKIFDLETLTKNNKIKGLNTRIKILQFNDIKPTETHKSTKITSRNTISDLSSLQNQKQKKIRISKIYNVNNNRRTIQGKYHSFRQQPKSMCELQGKAIISQDLLHRPFSYEKNINKWQKIQQTTKAYSTQNTRRRKSLPSKKNKQKVQKIMYNGSIKLDGLKLTGKKLNQTFEIDQGFLQKLTQAHNNNNQESQINLPSTSNKNNIMGGNIFINNNINLYISSKGQQFPKTSREVGSKQELNNKRQKFLSKRRLSHFNIYPMEQFQL